VRLVRFHALWVLTYPSFRTFQRVSDSRSLAFFLYSKLYLPLDLQSVSVSRSLRVAFFLCPDFSLCALQSVSAPLSLAFFPSPDLTLPLRSPGSQCPSLTRFSPCPNLSHPLCALVCECLSHTHFFLCPDLSLPPHSPESECPHTLASF